MFKIQNFLNRTQFFLSKFRIPKYNSKYQSSLRPLSRLLTLVPATCWLGINLLSTERLEIKSRNSIQPELDKLILKSEKKDVKDLMTSIITALREENLFDARAHINEGIQISEQNHFNEYLPHLYDLLVTVTMREGNNSQAEEILVRAIEKLTEVGYRETDNEIIQFKLMVARLYQIKGNAAMAGIGFLNCISIQEAKFGANSEIDEATSTLYLSLLFWYSIFLTDENKLSDSKNYMKKALEISKSTSTVEAGQTVVILYNLAELSFRLKVIFITFIYNIKSLVYIILVNRNTMM